MSRTEEATTTDEADEDLITADDKGVKANYRLGWAVFIGSALASTIIPAAIGAFIFGALGWYPFLGFLLGGYAGSWSFGAIVPEFFVRTGQVQKFVATSPYRGLFGQKESQNIVFPEGTLTPCVPFLGRENRGNVPMELTTVPIVFSAPGKNSEHFFEGVFQYEVDPEVAAGYVKLSDDTVRDGITARVKALIAQKVHNKTLDQVKKSLKDLNKEVSDVLMLDPVTKKEVGRSRYEKRFKIRAKDMVIQTVKASTQLQEARDATAQSEQMLIAIATMQGRTVEELKTAIRNGNVSQEDLINQYQIFLAKTGNAQVIMNTNRYSGLEAVANAIVAGLAALKDKKGG